MFVLDNANNFKYISHENWNKRYCFKYNEN